MSLSLDALAADFEHLGLSPYEARVLLALLRVGSANSAQLATVAGVPRTSTYQVIEELTAKGLAVRVAGGGPATWAAPARDDVFARLEAAQEERLRQHRERAERARDALVTAWPEAPQASVPHVQLVHSAARTRRVFDELFEQANSEVLVFSRPPFAWTAGKLRPVVVDAALRGVHVRALYERGSLRGRGTKTLRAAVDAYVAAGVEARVVSALPMKLVVFDRRTALVALTEPAASETGYPTNLLVEHRGFAEVQADSFEVRWSAATPYVPKTSPASAAGDGSAERAGE